MSRLVWMAISLGIVAVMPAVAGEWPQRYSALLDSSRQQVEQRVVVPSPEQPQGEVQLLRRGDALVVRTLLASRVLKQVVAAIDRKEQRHWPETRQGYLASLRYRDELYRATEAAWQNFRQRIDSGERRQFLAIEFIYAGRRGLIALSLPQLSGDFGQLAVTASVPLQVWRAPSDYVRNNIIEIVKDSFRLDEPAALALLAAYWPERAEKE